MKNIKVKTYVLIQTIIGLIIPLWYSMTVSVSHPNSNSLVVSVNFNIYVIMPIALTLFFIIHILQKKREKIDEYAKKALQIADSICFRASISAFIIIIFIALFSISSLIIGFIFTWIIFAVILLRLLVFCWIDKQGLVK
ncbi:MAG: hypothetical protein K2H01_02455 [Ruminococcus sp.]|nr:hypothetical protein [Ruminococcus sp.]